jgi:[acyl-carrier-protein] S-malonyltransferase
LVELGVTAVIELPPAGALVGMAKREMPGVTRLAIASPDDLEAARELITAHLQRGQGQHTPDFQLVAAPVKGVFTRAAGLTEGQAVPPRTQLGQINTNRDEHAVITKAGGTLVEWLRQDGDIVGAGLPIARLHAGSES